MIQKKEFQIRNYKCIVIGVSAGGMEVLRKLLPEFPADFEIPVIVVQHLHPNQGEFYIRYFDEYCKLKAVEAKEKEKIENGKIYFAPANYHLLVEDDYTFSLSVDPKISYSRPSINVLFQSAADTFKSALIGIILTGANDDGAIGMSHISKLGGVTIAQDPDTAEVFTMPLAAIEITRMDYILPVEGIVDLLR